MSDKAAQSLPVGSPILPAMGTSPTPYGCSSEPARLSFAQSVDAAVLPLYRLPFVPSPAEVEDALYDLVRALLAMTYDDARAYVLASFRPLSRYDALVIRLFKEEQKNT